MQKQLFLDTKKWGCFYPAHIRGPLFSLPASVASIPTAVVLLMTRCGVRYRTVFIGRRCETLTIWRSIWLTCETVWSKASSTTRSSRSTSGVHDLVPVSVRRGDILNSLCNLRLEFVIKWHFVCRWSWMYCFNINIKNVFVWVKYHFTR